ncbi:MAG: phytanoyl-CoA dioxygenase family protein [Kofleriaceae bacterium]|nr:phytanoyl-CoA dioxygenase family protein [Kofleriaceae bacterium]MBP9169096.1 phytanoyl-CoA dioxygenase family protein [Kofleriaceae bacterium]MBP9862034.1 phytanoyl-CoA dioxygenase family protein [Kofleriaceae bacterium]
MDRERAQAFAAEGLVVVPGAIPPAVIAAQRAALAEALAVDGVDLDDAATWRAGGGLPWIELAGALRPAPTAAPRMWQVSPPAVHDALIAGFAAALDAVFGAAQWAAQPGVQAMPNLPLPGPPWTPPHQAWHVDEPIAPGGVGPWGLLGFVALAPIAPAGGATVAIAGSHRRAATATPGPSGLIESAEAVAAIAASPAGHALVAPPPREVPRRWTDRGVDLALCELCGDAGDLILMDPRLLHTISANRSARPRLVMRLVAARA